MKEEKKEVQVYFVRKRDAKVAHIWDGGDTDCRMYSTGGIRARGILTTEIGTSRLCQMCMNVSKSRGAAIGRVIARAQELKLP